MAEKLSISQMSGGLKVFTFLTPLILSALASIGTYAFTAGKDSHRIAVLEEKVSKYEEDHDKLVTIDANVTTIKKQVGDLTTNLQQFMLDYARSGR